MDKIIKNAEEFSVKNDVLNGQHPEGWSPLMYACNYGQPDIAKELIWNKASVDNPGKDKMDAVLLSAREGYLDILKLVCRNNPLVAHRNSTYWENTTGSRSRLWTINLCQISNRRMWSRDKYPGDDKCTP